MRLIDADEYEKRIKQYDTEDAMDKALYNFAHDKLITTPSAEPVIRCKDCRYGREVCGNIECFVDSDILTEYHAYEWFCPNGERRTDDCN